MTKSTPSFGSSRNVKQRVAEQLKTASIKNYTIELDESAERDDGTTFSDHEVRAALARKKFENIELEWMRCSIQDLKTVLTELRTGQRFTARTTRHFRCVVNRPRRSTGRIPTSVISARAPFTSSRTLISSFAFWTIASN